MNEMYSMSIDIHDFGVLAFLAIVIINMVLLQRATDIIKYAIRMQIYMPISTTAIAIIIFTGMVMMAAKHLSFTIENIVMIIFSVALIFLESKRYFSLKHINRRAENAFGLYKAKAMKIMAIELVVTSLISVWMLMI